MRISGRTVGEQTPANEVTPPPPGTARAGATAEPSGVVFAVSPRLVLRVLIPAFLVLCLVSVVGRLLVLGGSDGRMVVGLVDKLNVNGEGNIPAWASSIVLMGCALSLWTVADAVRDRGRRWSWAWRLLAVAFVYLSVDELASLHEWVSEPLRGALNTGGALYFAWIVLAVPLVLGLALVLLPFLRALPARTRNAFLVAGALYVGGAAGVEMVGGALSEGVGRDTVAYVAAATLEELLEMIGMTIFLAAVNDYRRRYLGSARVVAEEAEPASADPSLAEVVAARGKAA